MERVVWDEHAAYTKSSKLHRSEPLEILDLSILSCDQIHVRMPKDCVGGFLEVRDKLCMASKAYDLIIKCWEANQEHDYERLEQFPRVSNSLRKWVRRSAKLTSPVFVEP